MTQKIGQMKEKLRITPYPLRMEPALRQQIEDAARAVGRSTHAEIIARLEASFEHPAHHVAPELHQVISELASLQELGSQAYQLQRAQRLFDEAQVSLRIALARLDELASAEAPATEVRAARKVVKEAQAEVQRCRIEIGLIDEQIAHIHELRKVSGMKELRSVRPVSGTLRVDGTPATKKADGTSDDKGAAAPEPLAREFTLEEQKELEKKHGPYWAALYI